MEQKQSWSPFKSLIKFKIYFIFSIWPGCTEKIPMNWCSPSLVNEAHLVLARHPGNSFPIYQLWEAVSHQPMTIFPPPCLGPPLFMAHKRVESGWWHYPSDMHQGIDVFVSMGLSYVWLLWGSTGWFTFSFFLLNFTHFILISWFISISCSFLIPRFKCFNL